MKRFLMGAMLAVPAAAALPAQLDRMFYTPAQRATLDNARKQNIRAEVGSDSEQQAAPVPQNISVNGLVRRSDGKNTIWLNNRPISGRQATGVNATATRDDGRIRLSVPETGRNVDLKVGQTVEILSGTIEEGYSRRADAQTELKAPASAQTVPNVAPEAGAAPLKSAGPPPRRSRLPEREYADDYRVTPAPEAK